MMSSNEPEQRKCLYCVSIFIGHGDICPSCKRKGLGEASIMSNPDLWGDTEAIKKPQRLEEPIFTPSDVIAEMPLPNSKVVIPNMEARDYTATIIIATPDTDSPNFKYCKYMLDKHTPGIHRRIIIQTNFNEKPYNWARDMNIGMRGAIDTDYYVIINDDIFVEDKWLDNAVAVARQDPKIGIVGALLLYPGKRIVQHAGGSYDPSIESWSAHGAVPAHHLYMNQPYKRVQPQLKQKDVVWCTGALLVITKQFIQKVGVMDEQLVSHSDDLEYGFRAWLNGFRVVFSPDVIAVHREYVTRKQSIPSMSDNMIKALKRMIEVVGKKNGDKVFRMVEESNRKHYTDVKEDV